MNPSLDHVAIAPVTRYQGECVTCTWWSAEYDTEGEAENAARDHERTEHPEEEIR